MTDRLLLMAKRQAAHALCTVPRRSGAWATLVLGVLSGMLVFSAVASASDIVSYAIVQDDGTPRVRGKTIRLFGVYIPSTDRNRRGTLALRCAAIVRCGRSRSRSGLRALRPAGAALDGSLSAVCYVDGNGVTDPPVDLGAWLIEQGLAVAGPGAPFEYQTLERIALVNGRGVWGPGRSDHPITSVALTKIRRGPASPLELPPSPRLR